MGKGSLPQSLGELEGQHLFLYHTIKYGAYLAQISLSLNAPFTLQFKSLQWEVGLEHRPYLPDT